MTFNNMINRRCRSKEMFWGAKDFCPPFPNLTKKLLCDFCQQIFSHKDVTSKKIVFIYFSTNVGPHFLKSTNVAPILPGSSGVLPRYLGSFPWFLRILTRFSEILAKFFGIFPGFSTNQTFWMCASTPCTPKCYTTVIATKWFSFWIKNDHNYNKCHFAIGFVNFVTRTLKEVVQRRNLWKVSIAMTVPKCNRSWISVVIFYKNVLNICVIVMYIVWAKSLLFTFK